MDCLAALVPLGRVANRDDIASAAVFLACNRGWFVNGAELFADSGMTRAMSEMVGGAIVFDY